MDACQNRYLAAQLVSLLLVWAVSAYLPGVPAVGLTVSAVLVWALASFAYRLAGANNNVGRYWLLALALVLCVGVALNYSLLSTSGPSPLTPDFLNSDMQRYYYGAAYLADTGEGYLIDRHAAGYGLVIAALWRLTGWSLLSPLMLNVLAALLAVVLTGTLTRWLLSGSAGRSDGWLMTAGMIVVGSVSYLTFSGTLLLKESLTAVLLLASALALLMLRGRGCRFWIGALLFVGSTGVLSMMRHSWVYIPLSGVALVAVGRGGWRRWLALSGVFAMAFLVGRVADDCVMRCVDAPIFTSNIVGDLYDAFIDATEGRAGYYALLEKIDYFGISELQRLLWLPMTMTVQYLIPFPWNFLSEVDASVTLAALKFSYPWYAVGGLVLYYWGWCFRRSPVALRRVTLWATLFWIGFAWFTGGTVSRYSFMLVPLLAPAAVWALSTGYGHKSFSRWAVAYAALMVVALVAAYIAQRNKMWLL